MNVSKAPRHSRFLRCQRALEDDAVSPASSRIVEQGFWLRPAAKPTRVTRLEEHRARR